ncbi:MAG: radical SAM protein [Candidatus Lokiarchaeota archaeon]|nr:radical SAM protein [Candidatus Lokiarchaeota archaeon]
MKYEYNTIIKNWNNIDLSIGLIYPNIYEIGLSSYAIRLLYSYINSYDNIVCERIFLPKYTKYPASEDVQSEGILNSIENQIHPKKFDILGFSVQFENDIRNVLWILEKSGIPISNKVRMKERIEKKNQYPLIVGGGPVITSNPISLNKIFDIDFIGDAEPNLDNFLKTYINFKSNNNNDLKIYLKNLSESRGIYIPLLKNKVRRVIIKNIDDSEIPINQIKVYSNSKKKAFEDCFFIEVNRGCPYQCKFCISSYHNLPFRNRSLENIKLVIERAKESQEIETISLIGSCVSVHPKFYEICELIIENKIRLTIPSLRIDHLSEKIIKILERGNIKTITVAPETGSEELRYNLGKKISNLQILQTLERIKDSKIENVKLYFLIGLPNEKEADIDAIINLIKKIDKLKFNKKSIRVSINPLIPKLNTPYEKEVNWYIGDNLSMLKSRFEKIQKELKGLVSINLKVYKINNLIKNAKLQTLISLGNERVSELLINYYHYGANFGSLRRAEKNLNFSIKDYFIKIKDGYSPWKLK